MDAPTRASGRRGAGTGPALGARRRCGDALRDGMARRIFSVRRLRGRAPRRLRARAAESGVARAGAEHPAARLSTSCAARRLGPRAEPGPGARRVRRRRLHGRGPGAVDARAVPGAVDPGCGGCGGSRAGGAGFGAGRLGAMRAGGQRCSWRSSRRSTPGARCSSRRT